MELDIPTVSERDLDLLLLREFAESTEFASWFLEQINSSVAADHSVQRVGAWISTRTGESDLEVDVVNASGETVRLLIENKITAQLQSNQAERYTKRGQEYRESGECDVFKTVLVAPEDYADPSETLGFEHRITYEELLDWFARHDGYGEYEVALVDTAMSDAKKGWQLVPDADATSFWRDYWQLSREEAPALQMSEPGDKPARSNHMVFDPPGLGSDVRLVHKLPYGKVDMEFKRMADRLGQLWEQWQDILDDEMRLETAGKSAAVRLKVPQVSVLEPFDEQREDVLEGLEAAKRLLSWYREHDVSVTEES